jgi:biotin synthesis protein BioG
MQQTWLQKKNRTSCILFFAGWGMDPEPFLDMAVHDHDLLMVYDYGSLEPWSFRETVTGEYRRIHLVAWSMGVWAAAYCLTGKHGRLASATAINGTLRPIDDRCGIDRRDYARMREGFSRTMLHDFYASIFTDPAERERFLRNRPRRDVTNIFHELVQIERYYMELKQVPDIFDRRIAGSRDRIFPVRNQVRCWGREQCTVLKIPHFPFYGWPSWDHFVAGTT